MNGRWLTLLLIAFPSVAAATGTNLAWNNCYPSPDARMDQSFLCDDSAPGANDANSQQFLLYGSVVPGIALTDFMAWTATLDVRVANATLDSWWELGTDECRGNHSIQFIADGFINTTTCNKLPLGAGTLLAVDYWSSHSNGQPDMAWYNMSAARNAGTSTIVATTEYQLFRVLLDSQNTKLDPAGGTTTICAGCADPACILLSYVELEGKFGEQIRFYDVDADHRNYVTWQGGAIGKGGGCPAALPVKRTTWGEVKTLYR